MHRKKERKGRERGSHGGREGGQGRWARTLTLASGTETQGGSCWSHVRGPHLGTGMPTEIKEASG